MLGGGLVHFLCDPQPFFRWTLTPAWVFFVWWPLSFRRRLLAGAASWREGPVEFPPRPSERDPAEVRLESRLGTAATALLGSAALGYLWPSLVLSGRLGALTGNRSPSEAAAALLGTLAVPVAPLLLEMVRHRWFAASPKVEQPQVWREIRSWALIFGVLAVGVLTVCLAGWVSPWPHTLAMLGRVGLVVAAVILFGSGWGAAFATPPPADGGSPKRSPWRILRALAGVGLHLLPWAVLACTASDVRWHVLAAISPNYAALSLLPGLWPRPPSLPFATAVAVPAGMGLLLLLVRREPRAAPATAPAKPAEPADDVLAERLRQCVRRYDNPILTLAARRSTRGGASVSVRLGRGAIAGLVSSMALLGAFVGYQPRLWGPAGSMGLVLLSGIALATAMEGAVRSEHTVAREERRLVFVLSSRLSDREIVCGILTAAGLSAGIPALPGVFVALVWCLFGFAMGTPWWWLLVWACLLLGAVGVSLQAALIQFVSWHPRRRLSITGWQLLSVVTLVLGLTGLLAAVDMALGGIARLPFAIPHILALATPAAVLIQAVTLPHCFRSAVAAVGAHRTQDDLA